MDTNDGGTLTVTLGPSPPDGAGWRFLGDTTQFYPSGYSTNLVVGTYLIQFAAVSGRVTPPNLSVQVQAGLTTTLAENYLLAGSAPAQAQLPVLVPSADIGDLADFPFGFDGQLQTDVGYGSGVAVETNVVLTAAHLVFNDQTLSYVNQAYWYFQRETGVFEPEPMAARGWYVLSGYAAQRTNDLAIYAPDTSTPQSRNLDVAALYFLFAGGRRRLRRLSAFGRVAQSVADREQFKDARRLSSGRVGIWGCEHRQQCRHDVSNRTATVPSRARV